MLQPPVGLKRERKGGLIMAECSDYFGDSNEQIYTQSLSDIQAGLVANMDNVTGATADSIWVLIRCSGDNQKAKGALYDDSDPRERVAETDEITLTNNNTATWYEFTFLSPPTLTANAEYALMAWSEAASDQLMVSPLGSDTLVVRAQSYDGWPETLNLANEFNIYWVSMYCCYSGGSALGTSSTTLQGGFLRGASLS